MKDCLLAIDQGTTNSRAILFDFAGNTLRQHSLPLTQYFPGNGWVEQDPEEMFQNTLICCREVMKKADVSVSDIVGIGLTNQRETTLIWDRKSGQAIYPAIVWQDRRTSEICQKMAASAFQARVRNKTGLLLDPYFSATKIRWILDHVPDARVRAERGELAFGTVDSWLVWKLTNGKCHLTDATNASRTMLFNIYTQQWDDDLLDAFRIPCSLLPRVQDSSADFGMTDPAYFGGAIPIAGVAGDQQAALVGQTCFHRGMIKATYGTGGFMLLNTGTEVIHSSHGLLSTIAWRLNGKVIYGLEGSIFSTGTTIKWLRDTLGILPTAEESEHLARSIPDTGGVYLVPAFTGLGAPYWDADARGALLGLTRDSGRAEIVRAALEAVAWQSCDLLHAMRHDSTRQHEILRVDGGMTANNWLMQFLSDTLNLQVQRPECTETTALGAAWLAGLQRGVFRSLEEIARIWKINATFSPQMSEPEREKRYAGWRSSVAKVSS